MSDFFTILGLEKKFQLDEKELERKYFSLQREYHPDRFALKPAAERIAALNKSTEITNAYRVLKEPLTRAEYLLGINGIKVGGEHDNVKPSQELLMEIMEIRERLSEGDGADIKALEDFTISEIKKSIADLAKNFIAEDFSQAAENAMRLRYLSKFSNEINLKKKVLVS